jgi:hypothetical protein
MKEFSTKMKPNGSHLDRNAGRTSAAMEGVDSAATFSSDLGDLGDIAVFVRNELNVSRIDGKLLSSPRGEHPVAKHKNSAILQRFMLRTSSWNIFNVKM